VCLNGLKVLAGHFSYGIIRYLEDKFVHHAVAYMDPEEDSVMCSFSKPPTTLAKKKMLVYFKRTSSGTHVLKPRQTYCYHSIVDYFKTFLFRPGFQGQCEECRTRETHLG